MKKRLLVGILILTMLVACLNVGALAAEGAVHEGGKVSGTMTGAEFIGAASSGSIQLQDDVTITTLIPVTSGDITIDLNNHNITRDGGSTIFNVTGGTLTVTGEGNITNKKDNGVMIQVTGSASKLIIEGGTFKAAENNEEEKTLKINVLDNATLTMSGGSLTSTSGNALYVDDGATLNMTGGEIKSTNAGNYAVFVGPNAKATVNLNGGKITSDSSSDFAVVVANGSTMTIEGNSTISSKGKALFIQEKSKVEIKGGNITRTEVKDTSSAEPAVVVLSGAQLTMSNGTVTGKEIAIQVQDEGSSANVTGGTIKNEDTGGAAAVAVTDGSSFKMTGGSIDAKGQGVNVGVTKDTVADETSVSTATIGGNAKVTCTGLEGMAELQAKDYGVLNIEDSAEIKGSIAVFENGRLNVSGGEITSDGFAISTNGSPAGTPNASTGAQIKISGGKITSTGETACGVYLPAGEMTVSGDAEISGAAGIVVRGGDLTVEGGTVKATGNAQTKVNVGDAGHEVPAAAITVDNSQYPEQGEGQKHVTIEDGAVLEAAEGGKTLAACNQGTEYSKDNQTNKVKPSESPFDIHGGSFQAGDKADKDNVDQFLPLYTELNDKGDDIQYTENAVFVVEREGVKYTTLKDALEAANVGDTIKLLADVTLQKNAAAAAAAAITVEEAKNPVDIEKTITIDLNGHKIIAEDEAAINVGDGNTKVANLTIKDSATGGTITSSAAKPTIRVKAGSTLTVEGGIIENTSDDSTTGAIQVSGETDKVGIVTVKGGTIKGANYGIAVFGKATLNVEGGTVEGTKNYGIATNGGGTYKDSTVTVTGGTIAGGKAGMYLPSQGGKTTVTGNAKITGTNGAGIVVRGGTIEVSEDELGNAPTITAGGSTEQAYGASSANLPASALVVDKNSAYGATGSAKLNAGTFEAQNGVASVTYYEDGTTAASKTGVEISGGTYQSGGKSDYDKIKDFLDLNLTTDNSGKVEADTNIVVAVPDANGNEVEITSKVVNGVVEVTVGGNVSTSHSTASPTNTWWAGVGFKIPEGKEVGKVKYTLGKGQPTDNNPDLDTWKVGETTYQGFAFWFDASNFPEEGYTIVLDWCKSDGTSVGTTTYHVTLAENTVIEAFEAKVVDFGYGATKKDALDAAAKFRPDWNPDYWNGSSGRSDWGDQTMWVTFAEPIPDGVTITVTVAGPNGVPESYDCVGNGVARTFAWSYKNSAQTGDTSAQLGDYKITDAKAETENESITVKVTEYADKTAEVLSSTPDMSAVTSGFDADADAAKEAINTEWKKVKPESEEIANVDDNTMWAIFQFSRKQSKGLDYTINVIKDGDIVHTEEISGLKNGLLVYVSFGNQLSEVADKAGKYVIEIVDSEGIAVASTAIEIYEVKYTIELSTNLTGENVDVFTTDPDSVEAPEVSDVPAGKVVKWTLQENDNVYVLEYKASVDNPPVIPSYTPSFPTTVEAAKAENGSVKLSSSTASVGTKVTVTVTPDAGYKVESVVVTDRNGDEVEVTKNEDGTYTFTVPAATPVTVTAKFSHICAHDTLSDVDVNQFYHEAVDYMVLNGFIDGYPEGVFKPNAVATRGQMLTIMAAANGVETESDPWYKASVDWAVAAGYSDGTRPTAPIQREEIVTILWQIAKKPASEQTLEGYEDAGSVNEWAKAAMAWAVENGIIKGRAEDRLVPQGTATRAELAQMLYNYFNLAK